MRIPDRQVLFTGQDQCPEFHCSTEPLPKELDVLLCLLDGAERRLLLQDKLNVVGAEAEQEKPATRAQEKRMPLKTKRMSVMPDNLTGWSCLTIEACTASTRPSLTAEAASRK
jgi:hypothetical protein